MTTSYRNVLFWSIGLSALILVAFIGIGPAWSTADVAAAPALHAESAADVAAFPLPNSTTISNAIAYVATQQEDGGGINSFGSGASMDGTARAALALAAAGRPVDSLVAGDGKTIIDYMRTQAVTYTHDVTGTLLPGRAGLLLAAVVASGEDPASFGGMDIVGELEATLQPTGAYSTTAQAAFTSGTANSLNQGWSVFGLSAAGRTVPTTATGFLVDLQSEDGTWRDPDTTAMVMTALIGSGNVLPTAESIQNAIDFYRQNQLPSGGWRPSWDTDPLNADTTGWAMQALAAAGYTPMAASWSNNGNTPRSALLSLQKSDGSIGGTYVNAYSTIDSIFGLTERPLTFLGQDVRAHRALTWLNEQQNANGSWDGWTGPDPGATIDAVLAYAAAGFDADTVTATGEISSAIDYLRAEAVNYTKDTTGTLKPAAAGKLILGVVDSGNDPTDFGTLNLVDELTATLQPTGAYSTTASAAGSFGQALAILGLNAAEQTIPTTATNYLLIELQEDDGGWGFGFGGDVDTTGLVLQALSEAGIPASNEAIVDGINFLLANQNDRGGWNGFYGTPSANSTAYAIQGLIAAGEDLTAAKWLQNGQSPFAALRELQKVDGPFADQSVDNLSATAQAVSALFAGSTPPASLVALTPINRGLDPDRMVVAPLLKLTNDSVAIPFGSDLNGDGTVEVRYRQSGGAALTATDWQTATVVRAEGFFSATIDLDAGAGDYEIEATYADADQVQSGSLLANASTPPAEAPVLDLGWFIHLPIVFKN